MLFVFWPAEQVKQIRQTLAHINITEKYRKDSKSGFEQQPKEESERPKVWRERSSGELKTYLSQRGVDMMEVDSERYLREIMGDPDFSVKPLNRLSKATTINVQQNSTQNIVSETSDELNTNKLRGSASEAVSSRMSIASTPLTLKSTDSIESQNSYSNESSQLVSESLTTSDSSTVSEPLTDLAISTYRQQSSTNFTDVVSGPDMSVGKAVDLSLPSNMNNATATQVVSLKSAKSPVVKLDEPMTSSEISNEVVIRSRLSKIYELNALIYNPLNLLSPEPILVELFQSSELVVYVPINLIENTNGTYLSQDHIELWLDRSEVRPQTGYGNISHQYGIGLGDKLWVVDFLQNESVYDLKVRLSRKGKLLEVKIVNLPPDLRGWNVVFSKAVKEGRNWVQGQLLSAVEDFTWGDSDNLIPVKSKGTVNAPK